MTVTVYGVALAAELGKVPERKPLDGSMLRPGGSPLAV